MAGTPVKRDRKRREAILFSEENAERTLGALERHIVDKGQGVAAVCKEHGWSVLEFMKWIHGDEGRLGRYKAACAVRSEVEIEDALAIVDATVDAERPVEVMAAALRAKERWKRAEVFAKETYGKTLRHEHAAVGDLGERLRRANERVIEHDALKVSDAEVLPEAPSAEVEPA